MRTETTGVDIPPPFGVATFDQVSRNSARFKDSHFDEWRTFAAAWNAIGFRQRAACDYNSEFPASINISAMPGGEDRYRQDHALFGFAVSQLSAFECLYFGVYCISSIRFPDTFPIARAKDLRSINPRTVAELLSSSFNASIMAERAISALDADFYDDLSKLRNFLSHRGTLPRDTRMGGELQGTFVARNPTDPIGEWMISRAINDPWVAELHQSATGALNSLIAAVARHISDIYQAITDGAT